MRAFYSDPNPLPLPAGHRFPAEKYHELRRRLTSSGILAGADILQAEPAPWSSLLAVHTPDYVRRVALGQLTEREIRRLGLPWSRSLVARAFRSVGATLAACRRAQEAGIAANLGGGTHHAFPDHGAGYCVFNDVAVAARRMQREGRAARVLIVDADVHQGDGTAAVFQDDPTVFTFSIHGQGNFPFRKVAGDLDVGLPDGTGDRAFLEAFASALALALERSRPDLLIYIAGADPHAGDRLGRLRLTAEGLAARDQMVFALGRRYGLPIAVTLGGGYGRDASDTVAVYAQTIALAVEVERA
ncbi:MAG TPA: histone deacetylase [Anaerolineales bacterium]|nr:histone deacetylase [Anaerolineales bacterium]